MPVVSEYVQHRVSASTKPDAAPSLTARATGAGYAMGLEVRHVEVVDGAVVIYTTEGEYELRCWGEDRRRWFHNGQKKSGFVVADEIGEAYTRAARAVFHAVRGIAREVTIRALVMADWSLHVRHMVEHAAPGSALSSIAGIRRYGKEPAYVYFLLRGATLVYVGRTMHLRARMKAHARDRKDFTEAWYVEVEPHLAAEVEREFIERFRPELNRQCVGHPDGELDEDVGTVPPPSAPGGVAVRDKQKASVVWWIDNPPLGPAVAP